MERAIPSAIPKSRVGSNAFDNAFGVGMNRDAVVSSGF